MKCLFQKETATSCELVSPTNCCLLGTLWDIVLRKQRYYNLSAKYLYPSSRLCGGNVI